MTKKKEAPEKVEFKDKIKSSYYLDKKTEERLMELYIKRMKDGQRPRKSQLVDEAVLCLYEMEIGKKD
jgi:hypothetical protein